MQRNGVVTFTLFFACYIIGMMKQIAFKKKAWKEGKRLVIDVPRCLRGEIDFTQLVRVIIEELPL